MSTPPPETTLLYRSGQGGELIAATEARFLTACVRDAVRTARSRGAYCARFDAYEIQARREPLGARLVTVSWRVSRGMQLVAADTQIFCIAD